MDLVKALIKVLDLIIVLLIIIRSPNNIQFRRQLSFIGSYSPDDFKKKFDQVVLLIVLIWLLLNILLLLFFK